MHSNYISLYFFSFFWSLWFLIMLLKKIPRITTALCALKPKYKRSTKFPSLLTKKETMAINWWPNFLKKWFFYYSSKIYLLFPHQSLKCSLQGLSWYCGTKPQSRDVSRYSYMLNYRYDTSILHMSYLRWSQVTTLAQQ